MIPIGGGILAGLGALCTWTALVLRVDPAVWFRLGLGATRSEMLPAVQRIIRRVAGAPIVRRAARADRLQELLPAADWSASLSDVIAVKLGMGFVALILVGPALLPLALPAAAGAFVAPDITVARAARRRLRRIDAEVVQFLDLLAAASSAGLAAPAAIRRAMGGLRGPLAGELTSAAASVEVGGRWRDELRAIAERLQLPDLSSAVTVISRTETLGSSLADSLRELAADVREARRARATERARTAPVKMLFPLVFMVLPAFLLLTVAPVLIATLRSLR